MNDECIVRKLTADGDGAGDDRRFITLINLLFKVTRERDPAQLQNHIQLLKETLNAAETTMKKQAILAGMNNRQIEEYKCMAEEIDKSVKESYERMKDAKKDLLVAKGVRKNKEQYELLADMIEQIPSREESQTKLSALKDELGDLHEKQRKLETKLTERRNYLHSISIILANLNRFLDESDKKEASEEQVEILSEKNVNTKHET
uniref:THO complex subunit 7 homolog n=1 Tax=Syphacia muris TaxID=451379 RepID=A0A0N5AJU9_9BILA